MSSHVSATACSMVPIRFTNFLVRTGHDRSAPDGDRDLPRDRLRPIRRTADDEVVDWAEPSGLEGNLIHEHGVTEKIQGRPDKEPGQDGGAVNMLQHHPAAAGAVRVCSG
jgi:hypothetical protein